MISERWKDLFWNKILIISWFKAIKSILVKIWSISENELQGDSGDEISEFLTDTETKEELRES